MSPRASHSGAQTAGAMLRAFRLSCLLCLGVWVLTCAGQPPAAQPGATVAEPLRYRMVYIPETVKTQQARGYRAISREVLEEKLAAIQATTSPTATSQAQIVDADYSARFDAQQLLQGQARYEVEQRSPARTLLPLHPCNLAILAARWEASGDEAPKPAILGSDPSRQQAVVTEGSGTLQLDWNLQGAVRGSEEVEFTLRVPSALTSSLLLELPENWVPLVDHGLVSGSVEAESPERNAPSNTSAAREGEQDAMGSTYRRWRILLGAHTEVALTLVTQNALERRQQAVLLRQESTYEFEEGGVNVALDWNLNVKNVPLRRLLIERPADFDILSATLGEKRVQITNSSPTETVLDFETPVLGTSGKLQLQGFVRFEPGKLWELPSLRPQGVFWQDATAQLTFPPSLLVEDLTVEQGHQIAAELQADGGASYAFRLYQGDSRVRLHVERREARVAVSSGTTIRYGSERIAARVQARFEAIAGETFELEAQVPSPWLVESIETVPADALDESALSLNLENRRLSIPLRDSIRSGHPVTVTISAERQLPRGNETLAGRQLRAVQFPAAEERRSFFSVDGVIAKDAFAQRLDPARLRADERELVSTQPGRIVLLDTPAMDRVEIAPVPQQPAYAATLDVTADVGEELLETHQFTIEPENLPVSTILIHFTHSRPEPPQWSLPGRAEAAPPVARQLDESTKTNLGIRGGETWEVTLPPQDGIFTLLAQRASPWHGQGSISLVSLPNASTQSGTLTLRARGGRFRIEAGPLQPIPVAQPAFDQHPQILGQYRYNPAKSVAPWIEAIQDPAGRSEAWAWSAHLDSWFEATGQAFHRVQYLIENQGVRSLSLLMPDEARDVVVTLDGEALSILPASGLSFEVPLPANRRYVTVAVRYRTRGTRLADQGWQTEIHAPLPTPDLPVLNRHWHVRVPPMFRLADSDRRGRSMLQKLLGDQVRWGNQQVFDIFKAEDWAQFLEPDDSGPRAVADRFLSALGHRIEQPDPVPWGTALQDLGRDKNLSSRLLVDHAMLTRGHLQPDELIPNYDGPSLTTEAEYRELGLRSLRSAGLILLVERQTVVVTHAMRLAQWNNSLRAVGSGQVFVSPTPAGSEEIDRWIDENASLVPPDHWVLIAGGMAWQDGPRATRVRGADAGWQSYHRELGAGGSDNSIVYLELERTSLLRTTSWGLLWIATGLVAWLVLRRNPLFLLLITASAILCIMIPEAYISLTRAVFWGSLLGWFVGHLGASWTGAVEPSAAEPLRSERNSGLAPGLQAGSLLLLIGLGLAHLATAQPPAESSAPGTPAGGPVHSVLVPVDEERQPVGQYYYVTREFYDELHRRAADAKAMPQGWLIRSAQYQGTASWNTQPLELEFSRLTARFEIEAFSSQRRVSLPLDKNQVTVYEAFLDDQPLLIQWNDAGTALEFDIAAARTSMLELVLQPVQKSDDTRRGFEFDVPPVPTARLVLNAPEGIEDVLTIASQGAIGRGAEMGPLQADLGPVRQVSVHWPAQSTPSAEPPQTLVSETLWMHVRPGSVVLDARLQLALSEGNYEPLRLSVDPQLRLVAASLGDDEPQPVTPRVTPGTRDRIEIPLPSEFENLVTVQVSFLLRNHSGFGNLRLPEIQIETPRNRPRWFALTTPPEIKLHETQPAPNDQSLTLADFAVAWGGTTDLPTLARELPSGPVDLGLCAELAAGSISANQATQVSVSERTMEVQFVAELEAPEGVHYQVDLQTPARLNVSSVTARDTEGEPLAARVSRNLNGNLHVFFERPVPQAWSLELRGRLPFGPADAPPIPIVSLLGAAVTQHEIVVHRRSDVRDLVAGDLKNLDFLDSSQHPSAEETRKRQEKLSMEDRSRLAFILTVPDPRRLSETQGTLTVRRNLPRTEARTVTVMSREGTAWQARLLSRIDVAGGVLDMLRFEIPASWQEPFDISPAAQYEVRELPGQSRRQLIVWPDEAIRRDAIVRISGKIEGNGTSVRQAPDIELLDADVLQRFLVVPQKVESQQISWDTISLQAVRELPPPFDQDFEPAEQEAYQTLGRKRFQATIQNIEPISGFPQVRLADFHLRWTVDQRCFGQAAFDIEPAAVESCRIIMPAEQRLLSATIGGLPAQLEKAPDTEQGEPVWVLRFGAVQLPQRILLTFEGPLPLDNASPPRRQLSGTTNGRPYRLPLAAPRLDNLPVARTLWTVEGPEQAGRGEPATPASQVDALRQGLFRLDGYATLIDLATESAATRTSMEVENWYRPWLERFAAARDAVERLAEASEPDERDRILGRLETMTRDQEAIAEQLRTQALFRRLLFSRGGTGEQATSPPPRSEAVPVRCMFQGGAPEVVFLYPALPTSTTVSPRMPLRQSRWEGPQTALALMLVVAIAVAFALLRTWVSLREWLLQWPGTVVAVAGCLWWLTMTPSVWGCFAMLGGILLSLTSGWRLRTLRRRPGNGSRLPV